MAKKKLRKDLQKYIDNIKSGLVNGDLKKDSEEMALVKEFLKKESSIC